MLRSFARQAPAKPITSSEFQDALFKLWRPSGPGGRPQPQRLGLAISGGADSMALAKLCAEVGQKSSSHFPFECHAFIVDHLARDGSTEEAHTVRKWLIGLGINARILSLTWPDGRRPTTSRSFESQARKLRFRALGLACRDQGIEALLLAHHADDQAETVMMRLVDDRHGPGLRGIKPVGEIPECEGLHGVHQSNRAHSIQLSGRGVRVETGGVKVLRPLLGFTKDRLVATCRESATAWVEDITNKDPTLTPRNAVRHLMENHALPAALGKPSLLALAKTVAMGEDALAEKAEELFGQCDFSLDVRSGLARVRFPQDLAGKDSHEERHIAALLIRRIFNLVSPCESIPLSEVETTVENIFPHLSDSPHGIFKKFNEKKLLVTRIPVSDCQPHLQPISWQLSRQRFHEILFQAPTKADSIVIPIPAHTTSPLHLWDGRFWISVHNPTSSTLLLRPLFKRDLQRFRSTLSKSSRDNFDYKLKQAAPNDVRFTLPVVALAGSPETVASVGENADLDPLLMGRVIVFPTLGWRESVKIEEPGDVKFEARYRKIDVGIHDRKVIVGELERRRLVARHDEHTTYQKR